MDDGNNQADKDSKDNDTDGEDNTYGDTDGNNQFIDDIGWEHQDPAGRRTPR